MRKVKLIIPLLLMLFVSIGNVWGADVTFNPASDQSFPKDGITISVTDGTLTNGTDYRVYKNQTMTISSTVGNITNIALTYSNASNDGGGWAASYQPNATSWTSPTANGEQARITKIVVTVGGSSTTYTVDYSLNGVTKTSGPDAGTWDGNSINCTFTANSNYTMPTDVTVKVGSTTLTKGSSGYSYYSNDEGVTYTFSLNKDKINGNVSITINGILSQRGDVTITASDHIVDTDFYDYITSWFTTSPASGYGDVSFSSDNEDVFYVDNNGEAIAGDPGTAHVTMSIGKNGLYNATSKTITVTVQAAAASYDVTYHVPACTGITAPTDGLEVIGESTYKDITGSIDGYEFVGWTTSSSYNAATAPSTLYRAGDAVTAPGVVYAVFHKTASTQFVRQSSISAGEYLIVGSYGSGSSGSSVVLKGEIDTKNRVITKGYEVTNNVISATDNTCIWIVEASGDYWTIKNKDNNKYLAASAASGNPDSNDRKAALNSSAVDLSKWTLTSSSNNFKMQNNGYSNTNGLKIYGDFGGFYGSSGISPYFFKRSAASENYTTDPTCPQQTYSVVVSAEDGGTATAKVGSGAAAARLDNVDNGATVMLTATPNTGYSFVRWTVTAGGVTVASATSASTTFTMPSKDVVIEAEFLKDVTYSGYITECTPATYTVRVDDAITNGTITLSSDGAGVWDAGTKTLSGLVKNENVSITVNPASGYGIKQVLVVTDDASQTIKYTYDGVMASREFAINNVNLLVKAEFSTLQTVTWYVDGETYTEGEPTTSVADGTRITKTPTDPAPSCLGKTFVGWTNAEISDATDEVPALYVTPSSFPFVTGNTSYYAVFATGVSARVLDMSTMSGDLNLAESQKSFLDGAVKLDFAINGGGSKPACPEPWNDARIYQKNSVTITSTEEMSSIRFVVSYQGVKRFTSGITASEGTLTTEASGYVCSWKGAANSVTFTIGEAAKADLGTDGDTKAGQLGFNDILIVYATDAANAGYTTSCQSDCESFTFHSGTDHADDWEIYCFTESSDSYSDGCPFYYTEEFTIPTTPNYYVGWKGTWATNGANSFASVISGWSDMYFHHLHKSNATQLGTTATGQNQGAVGYLCAWGTYNDNNKYVDFIPGGYVLRLGSGDNWNSLAFNAASSSILETVWETEVTTLTAEILAGKYFVGLKTETDFVWSPNKSQEKDVIGIGAKTNAGDNWAGSGLQAGDAGQRGKFRMWADNNAKNWNCHFVPTHRIIYRANYPAGESPADTYSEDVDVETTQSLANPAAPAEPTGYTFAGWYTAATDGTHIETEYTINAGASADVVLYAHWTPRQYNVSFVTDGGSAVAAIENVNYGTVVNVSEKSSEKTGYAFGGWTVTAGGVVLADNQFTMGAADVELTAIWTPNTNTPYVVKHYKQNLDGETYPAEPTETENLTGTTGAQVTPGRKGWSAGFNVPAGEKITIAADGSTVVNYYYTRKQFNITWDANGGEIPAGSYTSGMTYYEAPITKPADPVWKRHTFTGWSPKPGATLTSGDKNFVAQWTENEYEDYVSDCQNVTDVTVHGNNGEPEEYSACEVVAGSSENLCWSPTAPTGYELNGYWTTAGGGTKIYNADGTMVMNVTNYTDASGWISTKTSLDLYAHWTAKKYTITLVANDGAEPATADKELTATYDGSGLGSWSNFTRTGYTLDGYFTLAEGGVMVIDNEKHLVANVEDYTGDGGVWKRDGAATLYAHWTAKERTITYMDGDVEYTGAWASDPHPTTYLEGIACPLVDAQKDCYTFNGWYDNSELSGSKISTIAAGATGNKTFYAKWTQLKYTVSFDNLGHGSKPSNQNVNCGEKATDPNTADVAGWHLEGWYTDNGTWANKWDFENDVVTAATALYAHWVATSKTITCVTVIGSEESDCSTVDNVTVGAKDVVVTLNPTCITEGYHLYDWDVTTTGGSKPSITKDVENLQVTIGTMPNDDVKVKALLAPDLNVTGSVQLTSAIGTEAGTELGVITISSTNMSLATNIRIKYVDENAHVTYESTTRTNSEFRLTDDQYNIADGGREGGASNMNVTTVFGSENSHTFTMTFAPKAERSEMARYSMIVELTNGTTVLDSKTLTDIVGRTLPGTFVVATKYNGMWYALPNNMGEAGTYAPVLINVDEENKVAYGPATAGYGLHTFNSTNKQPLQFVGQLNKSLWASDATDGEGEAKGTKIRNFADAESAGTSTAQNQYAWVLTTSDMESYTMSPLNTTRNLTYWNDKWGMFTSGNTDMHFYPLQEVTPMTVTPTTWGIGWVEVAASTNPGEVQLIINGDNETVTATETAEAGIYRLADSRIGAHPCQEMGILKGSEQAIVKMPVIVASSTTTATAANLGLSKIDDCADCDIVVTNNATLTVPSSGGITRMGKLAVYAGARLEDANDRLTWDALDIRREGDVVGSARLNGANATRPVNFTWTFDEERWYWFTLPMASTTANATFLNGEKATLSDKWYLAEYDGAQRVTNGDGDNWPFCKPATLTPGKGYIIAWDGIPSGFTKQTLVMPMTGYTENANKSVTVYAYGAGTDAAANRVGWNVIGDPYLEYYGTEGGNPFTALLTGSVSRVDGTWTRSGSVPYVTIPINGGEDYYQQLITDADLSPFTSFFVQIDGESDGEELDLVFNSSTRNKRSVVARAPQEESNDPIIATLVLSNGNSQSDETSMVVWENFNDTYEVGGDLVKMKGDNYKSSDRPTLYSLHESGELAFQATNEVGAARTNPLGYYTKLNGEHVFSLKDNVDVSLFESIILVDNELSVRHNLLLGDYTFSAMAEENTTRFGIEIHLRKNPIVTGMQNGTENFSTAPRKIIYDDKLFILVGGKVYDGTGKLVNK